MAQLTHSGNLLPHSKRCFLSAVSHHRFQSGEISPQMLTTYRRKHIVRQAQGPSGALSLATSTDSFRMSSPKNHWTLTSRAHWIFTDLPVMLTLPRGL